MAPTHFSLVCFRAHPEHLTDETALNILNETLMQRLNSEGHFFISHTKLHGAFTLRAAIGNIRTEAGDIQRFWQELQAQLQRLQA